MKISLNWLKEYTDIDLPVDELVKKIGAQLGAVEAVESISERYEGIVIVRVVSCEKHPNADKLHICRVDDGGKIASVERDADGYVQVVCGAANVRENIMAAWLPPGTTVPASYDDDPFVLEARSLRGAVSYGMLASAKELSIGDSHEGILELDDPISGSESRGNIAQGAVGSGRTRHIVPGDDFATIYDLSDDYIIDIENKMFTHRPDCFGILGVAREVAGILGTQFVSPGIYNSASSEKKDSGALPINLRNEIPEVVPRIILRTFSNINIGHSPVWLQTYLSRVGIRPINNIVDITNYVMYLTGQPLHAYDYDKVRRQNPELDKATIVVRYPHSDEKLTLLNGKTIAPHSKAIVIATEAGAIGLAGVMGGADTEIDENTKNIILEVATFDMYSIRRTAMEHGIFSDAVTRFNKGQSPLQNASILAWATAEILRSTSGKPQCTEDSNALPTEVIDRNALYAPISIELSFINDRLGSSLTVHEISRLLSNVEFSVLTNEDSLTVIAPFWRTDIEIREDVVEEVGRLYGFDKLPISVPERDISPVKKNGDLLIKESIRNILSAAGANEVLSYSFVHGKLLEAAGQDKEKAYRIGNALSPDLQYYRLSLTPSLLNFVRANVKSGYDNFVLFELNKVHVKGLYDTDQPQLPGEVQLLAIVLALAPKMVSESMGAPYYQAKHYITHVLTKMHKSHFRFVRISDYKPKNTFEEQLLGPYDPRRSAIVLDGSLGSGNMLGVVGEPRVSIRRALKLPEYVAMAEINTSLIPYTNGLAGYRRISKYPKVSQDISLRVSHDVTYEQLYNKLFNALDKLKMPDTMIDLQPKDIFQRDDDTSHKQIMFRVTVVDYLKTLKSEEVNTLLDKAATMVAESLSVVRL